MQNWNLEKLTRQIEISSTLIGKNVNKLLRFFFRPKLVNWITADRSESFRRSILSYLKKSKKTLKILSRATKNTRKNVQGELEFKPLNFWWRLWFSGLLWRFSLRSSTCFLMQNSLFQLYSFTSRVNTNFLTGQNYSNISSERNSFNLFTFSRIYFETHVEIREILFWSRLVEF